MRTAIAITLIICGTLLVLAPAIYDFLLAAQVTDVLVTRTDLNSVRAGEPLASFYRLVCWVVGVAMIATAVICSISLPVSQGRDVPAVT